MLCDDESGQPQDEGRPRSSDLGRRFDKLFFVSQGTDPHFPIFTVDAGFTGSGHLTAKTMRIFDRVYRKYADDYDWFMKTDDDNYVILENLRRFLASQNTSEPVYFGQQMVGYAEITYMSGDAWYVWSREALRRFGNRSAGLCVHDGGSEDMQMGRCLHQLGVAVGSAIDDRGRILFLSQTPAFYLNDDENGSKKVSVYDSEAKTINICSSSTTHIWRCIYF